MGASAQNPVAEKAAMIDGPTVRADDGSLSAEELAQRTSADHFGGSRTQRWLALGARGINGDVVADRETPEARTRAALQRVVVAVGGTLIALAMVLVVLTQVWQLDIIANSGGPWGNMTSDIVTYGTAAIGLLGISLVVAAAGIAIGAFNMGSGGGGGGLGGMGGR